MSDLSREVVGWRNRAQTAEREVQRLSHTRIALSLRVQELEQGFMDIQKYNSDCNAPIEEIAERMLNGHND